MGDEAYKIYVSNLPFHYRANDLENLFISRVGGVAEGKGFIPTDRDGRSKGFGFVCFTSLDAMQQAIDKMDKRIVEGRDITVVRALPRGEGNRGAAGDGDRYRGGYSGSGSAYEDRERERERERGYDRGRDSYREREREFERDRRAPAPRGSVFKVSLTGLPQHFTWKELKDILRSGSPNVTYAKVDMPGHGHGEFATALDRDDAIRALNGRTVDGCTIRVRALDEGLSGAGGAGAGGYADEGYGRGGYGDARAQGGYGQEGYRSGSGYDQGRSSYSEYGRTDSRTAGYGASGAYNDRYDGTRGSGYDTGYGAGQARQPAPASAYGGDRGYADRYDGRVGATYDNVATRDPRDSGRYMDSSRGGGYAEPARTAYADRDVRGGSGYGGSYDRSRGLDDRGARGDYGGYAGRGGDAGYGGAREVSRW